GQLPVFYNYKPTARRGYVLDSIAPLFPFGFGLSYTTFAYSNLRLTASHMPPMGTTSVLVDVRNSGERTGDEVVEMYVHDEVSAATRPVKELRGFQRVTLSPGETRTVAFEVRGDLLAYHGPDMKRVVEPGEFQIMVGGSSVDLKSIVLTVDRAAVAPSTKSHDPDSHRSRVPKKVQLSPSPIL
ncbi:MAG TPA: fibronectin type III-like domain-contianing protein, partial [Gemmatimonadaceae bacterium]|nr:fibronectin type III-like domain-contianing protein [Gemmatimonadaceae bacterium]